MSISHKYRTFDSLYEDVSIDFSNYALENMMDPAALIKVATRVNYDLGLRIHRTKEMVLDIEHGRAKLPADFAYLNYAFRCGEYTIADRPPSGTHIEFKFLNSAEEKEISDAQDKIKRTTNSPVDRNVTTRLKNTIIAIDGKDDPTLINNYVDTLNVRDSRALRKYMEDNTPDIDMKQDFECAHCGHRGEVDVPIAVGFFWPES